MSFDWSTYLELADELAMRSEESCQRSAISRAYYAAFCSAREKLEDEGKLSRTGGGQDHIRVWNSFQTSGEKTRRRIGQFGNSLKRMRGKADYEDEIPELPKLIARAPRHARKMLSDLQSL